ncbi:MAG: TonB-dependent receptor [Candidatus Binatia bacterium]
MIAAVAIVVLPVSQPARAADPAGDSAVDAPPPSTHVEREPGRCDPASSSGEPCSDEDNTARLPSLVVEGDRSAMPAVQGAPLATQIVEPETKSSARGADSSALLQDVPGAAVVRNGPQSGIVQLRGLSGDRVKVDVDGMTITPACPNHMDPPLHYSAPSEVGSATVMAGMTPVSRGGDSIGGTVVLQSRALRFAEGDAVQWTGDGGALFRGSNEGWGAHGGVGVATGDVSLAYHGTSQQGDDLRYPGGRVRASGYDTQKHTVRSAVRTHGGDAIWGFETGVLRTRDSGTPALPMDMTKDDGTRFAFDADIALATGSLRGLVYYNAIDHRMDNYSLRPLAPGSMPMLSDALSDDTGTEWGVSIPSGLHTMRVGTGFHLARTDVSQQNVMSGLKQDTFRNAWRTRIGTYAELESHWTSRWTTMAGVRNDTVLSDAADIRRFYPMGTAPGDAAAFNARDHAFTDANFDITAALRFDAERYGSWEFGFARKNRAPSILERYLWTPLAASAGLADGRTYIGNLDLDSETSHQLSITGAWRGERWRASATPFYNFVSDYIQGSPVPYGSGTVLQFQNLDRADLYGIDLAGAVDLPRAVSVRGWMSYVRGRDREHDDNLYRISPLHGLFALEHRPGSWRNAIEVAWAASQHETSAYNDEPSTSGWAVLNLRAGYTYRERLTIGFSLENVLDNNWSDHLGGINRVTDSDVAVGQRLPGAGRFVFLSLDYKL